MRIQSNRARQLLALPSIFANHGNDPIAIAIEQIASEGGVSYNLRDRLYVMVATLPSQVIEQASAVMPLELPTYRHELDRVVQHFRAHSLASRWVDFQGIYDKPVHLALNAVAHVIDLRLSLGAIDSAQQVALHDQVRELVVEIRDDPNLDEATRAYLLSVAVHLREVLDHFDLFGVDGIIDLQGRFFAEMINLFPDLIPQGGPADDDKTPRRYTRVLWNAICAAAVLTGLPNDAISLAGRIGELLPGH